MSCIDTSIQRKLNRVWFGPFTIIKRLSKDSYIVKDIETRREYRRHINLIRPLNIKQSSNDKLPTNEDSLQVAPTADNNSVNEVLHDFTELNEACPGTESRIESWSARLRPRKQ